MYNRNPAGPAGRSTLAGIGGFGGPVPRDLLVILGVVFATFALQFFDATRGIVALLRLTPLVWQSGFVWQLATYPFIGYGGPSIWFLLELLILFWFGRDVFAGLRRRHFWRMLVWSTVGSALVAVAVQLLAGLTTGGVGMADFTLMQGQRMLMAIFIAAFATANRDATILLFFILPIQARWFLALEILFAFMGFLATKDLPGFLGICAAVGLTWGYIKASGTMKGGGRTLRETRLRLERWWIQRKLERNRKKRGFRVIQGEREQKTPDGRRGPWVH
ncbi:MAG TPA: hypothetical protein VEL74_11855 [Thermoanaerobaculia bacterium]|nr:hypothetical protein [Thermoanaerobaculia bacterium]